MDDHCGFNSWRAATWVPRTYGHSIGAEMAGFKSGNFRGYNKSEFKRGEARRAAPVAFRTGVRFRCDAKLPSPRLVPLLYFRL